ncbi:MAG TPA: serine hydrolase domain-containing protein [Actinomycetota bacterium]
MSGHVLAVLRAGEVERLDVTGVANADTGDPLTGDSLFYVGSLAKQFVAACARLLADDGALDLDAPVSTYVDGLPDWGEAVRVRHLIHHTSGIADRNYADFPGVPIEGVPARDSDNAIEEIRRLDALVSPPGTRYRYANRGYHLLGYMVARAAGVSVASFAHERLFSPLGMIESFFRDAPTDLPRHAARGHFEAVDGGTYVEPARFHAVGAGGLWTSVADLARWDAAFYDPTTVAPRLTERGALDDGTPIHYAWGLSVRTHRGQPIHSHGGSFPGWNAKMVRFPEQRTTVLVLANRETLDVSALALDTADAVLAEALDPDAPHADDTFDGVT